MFKKLINSLLKKKVPPIEGYFPSYEGMSKNQQRFYKSLKKNLNINKALELEGNIGYIFVYLYDILDSKQPQKTIYNLRRVQNLYKQYEKINLYCQYWISDCYVLLDEIQNAITNYPKQIGSRASCSSDSILSLKLHIDEQPKGEDLLSLFGPKITNFFIEDIDKIKNLIDKKISEDCLAGNLLLENWSKKRAPYKYGLFQGSYRLCYAEKVKEYSFSLIPEVEEYVKKITRDAENSIREEKGVPRVGEGWISETKLYYLLQKRFPDLEIIQHASPSWLGRQHLDIFFPEIHLAIEYQGEQHDRPIEFFGGEDSFKDIKKRDRKKKRLCKRNGVRLIEVREGFEEEELFKSILEDLQ